MIFCFVDFIEKDKFFKSSTEQFKVTEEYGVTVIKKYPDYKKNNQIFYAMAINSRDFDESKRTDNFLRKAIEANPKDLETVYNSKVGLAEFYYNNKKYSEAIGFYQDVLKNTSNEWYAKHLYNSAIIVTGKQI